MAEDEARQFIDRQFELLRAARAAGFVLQVKGGVRTRPIVTIKFLKGKNDG